MHEPTEQLYSSFTDLIESTQEPETDYTAQHNHFIDYITAFFAAIPSRYF